jgi:16S rRNA (cytidine1402-2'-O)-methyltransferase
VARELTKVHEEFRRGTLAELAALTALHPPRGEVTLVVAGASAEEAAALGPPAIDLEQAVDARLAAGDTPREIAAALSLSSGKPRRQIYQLALARMRRVPT